MKNFLENIACGFLKVLFVIVCYIVTICLAVCSAYFTILFYSTGYTEYTYYMVVGLAGLFEFTKTLMSITAPFMKGRNAKIEKIVSIYLKVALVMSILASLSFFLSSDISKKSPPNEIVTIIYSYLPILDIIPIKFVQFVVTMSLSVFIEVLIIIIPLIAVIFMYQKKETIEQEKQSKIQRIIKNTQNKAFTKLPKWMQDYDPEYQEPININNFKKKETKETLKQSPEKRIYEEYDNTIPDLEDTSEYKNISENVPLKNSNISRTVKLESIDGTEKNINLKPEILKYLDYMYSNIKNKEFSPGKRDIKKAIGLKYRTIDLIWEQLEKLDIVEVVKHGTIQKTKILKGKTEAKKLIHEHF